MAANDDDSSSCDLEVMNSSFNPFQDEGLGQRSKTTQSILQNAAEDRRRTKAQVKYHYLHMGTAKGTANVHVWGNRFELFRSSFAESGSTPTADQLERFLYAAPKHIAPRYAHMSVAAYSTIDLGMRDVISYLIFTYEDFKLSDRAKLRLSSIQRELLQTGQVTKQPSREPLWITSRIVGAMVTAMLKDAIVNGTRSWDTTLQRSTILVMHSALASRIGSITEASTVRFEKTVKKREQQARGVQTKDDPLADLTQTLVWDDISLVLEKAEDGMQRLSARVTLNFCKGERDDPSKSHISEFIELPHKEYNILCPCKMLCILALRYGVVAETSWDELISKMLARPSNKAVWLESFRQSPVFCRITNGHSLQLDFGKPASDHEGSRALAIGASLAGVLGKPTTHDLRRGGAAELAHLDVPLRGGSSREGLVRLGLGHTSGSAFDGTTDKYVGHLRADTWTARLQSKPMIGAKHDLQLASTSYRPVKYSKLVIDGLCERYGIDATAQKERDKAALRGREEDHTEWIKQQKVILDTPANTNSSTRRRALPNTPVRGFFANAPSTSSSQSYAMGLPIAREPGVSPPKQDNPTDPRLADVDSPLFDPTSSSQLIQSTIFDQNENEQKALLTKVSAHSQFTADSNDDNASSSATDDPCSVLTAGRDDFVRFLSTVNIVKMHSPISGLNNTVVGVNGGSRDLVTRYLFSYHNKKFGCPQEFPYLRDRDEHSAVCKFDSPEAAAEREHHCDKCPQSFKDVKELRAHIKHVHEKDTTVYKCSYDACRNLPAFATANLLRKHRDSAHKGWIPRSCPVPDCSGKNKIWDDASTFKRHLTKNHHMTDDEVAEYIPANIKPGGKRTGTKSEAFVAQKCPITGCSSNNTWKTLPAFTVHRLTSHRDYKLADVEKLLKWDWKTDKDNKTKTDAQDSQSEFEDL